MKGEVDNLKSALEASARALERERLTARNGGGAEVQVETTAVQVEVQGNELEPEHDDTPVAPAPTSTVDDAAAVQVLQNRVEALEATVVDLNSRLTATTAGLNASRATVADMLTLARAVQVDVATARLEALTVPAAVALDGADLFSELKSLLAVARSTALTLTTHGHATVATGVTPVAHNAMEGELKSIRDDVARARGMALDLLHSASGAAPTGSSGSGSAEWVEVGGMLTAARGMAADLYAAMEALPSIRADVAAAKAIALSM